MKDSQLGFIVDEVNSVLNIPKEYIAPPPQMGRNTANHYLIGVAQIFGETGTNEKVVLCLDATRALYQDEFESLKGNIEKGKKWFGS